MQLLPQIYHHTVAKAVHTSAARSPHSLTLEMRQLLGWALNSVPTSVLHLEQTKAPMQVGVLLISTQALAQVWLLGWKTKVATG